MTLEIIKAAPFQGLQDLGRQRAQSLGYSASGAADEHAFLWANRLLENPANRATLEISFGPFTVRARQACIVAVCGAANQIRHNSDILSGWRSIALDAGDELTLLAPQHGVFTYLSAPGGFKGELTYNSVASIPREQGATQRQCQRGDILEWYAEKLIAPAIRSVPPQFIKRYDKPLKLDVILESDPALKAAHTALLSEAYAVGQMSNRMAYQLEGEPLPVNDGPRFSSPTPFGSIQLPPSGFPYVLLKDRQTIGGYPVLGYVSQLSAFALSQRRPGQSIRFSSIDRLQAEKELKRFYDFF